MDEVADSNSVAPTILISRRMVTTYQSVFIYILELTLLLMRSSRGLSTCLRVHVFYEGYI